MCSTCRWQGNISLFSPSVSASEFRELAANNGEYAYAWYCKSLSKDDLKPKSLESKKFRLRVYNIAVGDPGIYSAENLSPYEKLASGELLEWYVGEVHITRSNGSHNHSAADSGDAYADYFARLSGLCEQLASQYESEMEYRHSLRRYGTHRYGPISR